MTSKPLKNDDLIIIPGIGPARQKWLRNTFNIHTYQELAALSAEQIQNRLKEEGQIASLAAIRAWLVKAGELAASLPVSDLDERESSLDLLNPLPGTISRENGWKPFASFVVEFQSHPGNAQSEEKRTIVHHMEADMGMTWSGIETNKLCLWMSDQIGEPPEHGSGEMELSPESTTEVLSADQPFVKVKIRQVRLFQPPQVKDPVFQIEAGSPEGGSIVGNKPFQSEVSFQIFGVDAAEIAQQEDHCRLQAYAYELSSGKSIVLGEAVGVRLQESKLDYSILLQPVTLAPGFYRYWISVTPRFPSAIPDFLEIPGLKII